MQTIYAYSYNPTIATGTNTTGTNWRMAYQQPIMLYKGTSNSVRLVVFNVNQKIVNLTGYDVQVQLVDRETQEHFVTKLAVVSTPTSGVASITFNESDLRNLEHRFYHLIARLVNHDDGSSITASEILYLDDNYGAFTTVTIENAWNYVPGTISTVEGPLLTVGNIIPADNDTYWLGNVTNQWHNFYTNIAHINTLSVNQISAFNEDFFKLTADTQILQFTDMSNDPTHQVGDGAFLTFYDITHQNDGPSFETWYGEEGNQFDPPGQHSLDIHAAANSYVELASHDLNSFIGVDDIGPFIQTQWLEDQSKAWRFLGNGELRLPSVGSRITSQDNKLQIIMTYDDIRFVRTDLDGSTQHTTVYDTTGDLYNEGSLLPGSFTPDAEPKHSLGSPTHPWKDLYVSNTTIYMGGIPISVNETGNLTVNGTVVATESKSSLINGSYIFALDTTGNLVLPTGGTIKNSDGSVYNGNINTGDIAFRGTSIYSLNGIIIENADLSHGATSALILPVNGDTANSIQLTNTYGNIQLTAGASPSALKNWLFKASGDIALPGNIQFTDNSVQSTAYRFNAQDAVPTLSPGSLWYNSDEGRLYINYNDTWVDASPTQIDPSALRSEPNGAVELPSGLKFDLASNYAPATGTTALQNAGESLLMLATGAGGMSGFGWSRNPFNFTGGTSAILFNAMEANGAVIQTGTYQSSHYWTFGQNGNLTLPEGGEILTSTGDSYFIPYGDNEVAAYLSNNPPPGTYDDTDVAAYLPTALPAIIPTYNAEHNWTPIMTGVVQQGDNLDSFRRTLPFNYTWDARVYSREGYTRGCFMSAVFTGSLVSFGLTSRPALNGVTDVDYRFETTYVGSNHITLREGSVVIEENVGPFAGVVAKIVYDGTNIIYYIDDTVVRTVARPIGAPLHFAASWYYDGAINNVKFGPYGTQQTPGVGIPSNPPEHSYGKAGDLQGMVAFDGTYTYYCTQNYVNNSTAIWKRVAWSGDTW